MPEFIDAHGIAIVYDVHAAEADARGVVQLSHGVGEHSGRYAALIASLTQSGYTVYAADHRGHGRTGVRMYGPSSPKMGKLGPGGLRAALAAMWQFTELIREENPGLPLILLGHSGGSVLAQMLVNSHPEAYEALVLSGSALRWPGYIRFGGHNRPWRGKDATGVEWLCTDPSVGAAFLDDPLTTTTPPLKLFGVADSLRTTGLPRRNLGTDIPTLLMVGRDDRVGGPRSVHKLADAYRTRSGFTDVTTFVYPDARHEIFNEVNQERVRADLLAWLDARFPARSEPRMTDAATR